MAGGCEGEHTKNLPTNHNRAVALWGVLRGRNGGGCLKVSHWCCPHAPLVNVFGKERDLWPGVSGDS